LAEPVAVGESRRKKTDSAAAESSDSDEKNEKADFDRMKLDAD
jgi:hypothetical protein